MQIYSFSPFGYEGNLVSVEVDIRRGIPAIDIVGLADGAVKESRERVKSAIRNSGYEFPWRPLRGGSVVAQKIRRRLARPKSACYGRA